jgi:hypothetical protein
MWKVLLSFSPILVGWPVILALGVGRGIQEDQEAERFSRTVLESRALTEWDATGLLGWVTPDYWGRSPKRRVAAQTVAYLSKASRVLGRSLGCGDPKAEHQQVPANHTTVTGLSRPQAIVSTATQGQFEKGAATIKMTLILRAGKWGIGSFSVEDKPIDGDKLGKAGPHHRTTGDNRMPMTFTGFNTMQRPRAGRGLAFRRTRAK